LPPQPRPSHNISLLLFLGGAARVEGLRLQAEPLSPPDRAGCPLTLTSAQLNWPPSYLPVTTAQKVTQPSLALGFRNSSGKAIRSVGVTARFLGKTSVYQLDASSVDVRISFAGADGAKRAAEQLRQLQFQVPDKTHLYGVTRVSLAQVLFADGTLWTPFGHGDCSLEVGGTAERVVQ
jgi:hypothetical protein